MDALFEAGGSRQQRAHPTQMAQVRDHVHAVAAYLATLDISTFDPKAPPPKTDAFWAIVDANHAAPRPLPSRRGPAMVAPATVVPAAGKRTGRPPAHVGLALR
jgi:hypothetical protein